MQAWWTSDSKLTTGVKDSVIISLYWSVHPLHAVAICGKLHVIGPASLVSCSTFAVLSGQPCRVKPGGLRTNQCMFQI